jgi:hypothetical protein
VTRPFNGHLLTPGRPMRQPDLERSPESWWLRPEMQQDRARFTAKAAEEQPRMRKLGLHSDPMVWKS